MRAFQRVKIDAIFKNFQFNFPSYPLGITEKNDLRHFGK
jgi:hypothetical protein